MQKYQDVVLRSDGRPAAGATIAVRNYPANTVATIYSDNGVTPIAGGGVVADDSGEYAFYAANGRYSLIISYPGFAGETRSDILLFDPSNTVYFPQNVGIGAAPGGTRLLVSDANPRIRFSNTSGTASTLLFGADSGSVFLGAETNAPFYFITNNTERMRLEASGNVGIGGAPNSAIRLDSIGTMPAAATAYNIAARGTVSASTTSAFSGVYSQPNIPASLYLTNFWYFNADGSAFGAGSTVANVYGYAVQSNLTQGTNNYGFFSNIPSGINRWNFYANGTADNYFAGNCGIGTTSFGTSAAKVLAIGNGTAPTTSPAGMGQLWVESGALKYRGSSGTVTTIASA
jgi:hypothetical protein